MLPQNYDAIACVLCKHYSDMNERNVASEIVTICERMWQLYGIKSYCLVHTTYLGYGTGKCYVFPVASLHKPKCITSLRSCINTIIKFYNSRSNNIHNTGQEGLRMGTKHHYSKNKTSIPQH